MAPAAKQLLLAQALLGAAAPASTGFFDIYYTMGNPAWLAQPRAVI